MPCKFCKNKHNSLLHFDKNKSEPIVSQVAEKTLETVKNESVVPPENTNCSAINSRSKFVVLPTVVVSFSCGNASGFLRAMLDCCSQVTLLADSVVEKFKLPITKSVNCVSGLGSQVKSSYACNLTLMSRISRFQINVDASVVSQSAITYLIPSDNLFASAEPPVSLKYAEKSLGYRSIDMIIGNEYYERCMLNSALTFDGIVFKETRFGWTPTGPISKSAPTDASCNTVFSFVTTKEIHDDLRKFWEIEEVEPIRVAEPEHVLCEQHFNSTFTRAENGRFIVRLPVKGSLDSLGDSRVRALRCLLSSERRRSSQPKLDKMYRDFMKEYEALGHMSLVAEPDLSVGPKYYIPHHAVLRPSSTTTKLRVVFNASAQTVNGPSLNELLMCGPKTQADLFDILINFRMHRVAFGADVTKMYRQVFVNEADRDLQRILWRDNPSEPIKEYRLNTVTYGTVSASFLATKCLSVLAESAGENSEVAHVIKNCVYMDDLLCSAPTVEEALKLQRSVHAVLMQGQFPLRKYISNESDFLRNLDPKLMEGGVLNLLPETTTYVLGLIWEPNQDVFRVKIAFEESLFNALITKRVVIAFSARIFDPLGFLAPVTIGFKILLQNIWREKKGWDDPVSEENRSNFLDSAKDLEKLREMTIRRPYSLLPVQKRQLIGFCDASLSVYCAVVYMKTISYNDSEETFLICSKTKVTPLAKKTSDGTSEVSNIHRFELMAAALLADLIKRLSTRLAIEVSDIRTYSDSKVTLCWLAKPPETWKLFIRNRVAKIQALIPYTCWSYVRSHNNPADLPTRKLSSKKLIDSEIWVRGPTKIDENDSEQQNNLSLYHQTVVDSAVENTVNEVNSVTEVPSSLFESSSFNRLLRAVARILRLRNRKTLSPSQFVEPLSAEELKVSFLKLVKHAQELAFPEEIRKLKNGKSLERRSRLWFLEPVLDEEGVMRASGRLQNTDLCNDKRQPIIMNSKNAFILLYAKYIHEKYFHSGAKFIVSFLSNKFRFVGGIHSLSKAIVRKCVVCARFNYRPQEQQMAPLPLERVTISSPFTVVMIDFAGPFDTKCVGHRSVIHFKTYLCVFVCLSTRAVHFEVSSSLETERFLQAFDRFKARRGPPRKIYSDNGSTFKKARNLLNFDWKLGPPYGPHHQGLAEAAVKSAKRCLMKVTKNCVLTFEEYNTIFAKIEATLNSRPLCAHRDGYITPGHFLTGKHLLVPPEPELVSVTLDQRYHLVEKIFRDFWCSWSRNYLNEINNRTRWLKKKPNLKIGDVVLVFDPDTKPSEWPLAVITKVHVSTDDLVRRVTVRCGGKEYEKPITRIILLPIENSDSESSRGTVC